VTSSPTLRISPPQVGHVQLGSCRTSREGRCAGKALRSDFLRSGDEDGSTGDDCSPFASGAAGAGASASSSSSRSSSCSIVRAIFSDERPNCMRRSRAICSFSFSTSSAFANRPALAAASSASRASPSAACARMMRCSSAMSVGRVARSRAMRER
jgi:hypothetical protein